MLSTILGMTHVELILVLAALAAVAMIIASRFKRGERPPRAGQRRRPNSHYRKDGQPKRSYDTRKEAMVQARVLANRDGAPMDAYRCAECHKWHVGHET